MANHDVPGSESLGLHRLFEDLRSNLFHVGTNLRDRVDGRVDGILHHTPDDNHRVERLLSSLLVEALAMAESFAGVKSDPED